MNHWPLDIASTDTDASHFFLSASGNTGRNEVAWKTPLLPETKPSRPTSSDVRGPTSNESSLSLRLLYQKYRNEVENSTAPRNKTIQAYIVRRQRSDIQRIITQPSVALPEIAADNICKVSVFLVLLSFLSLLTYGHCKWWNTSLWGKVQSSMLKSMALQRWEQSAQRRMPLQIIEMTQQATSTSNNILSPTWFSET